MEKRKINIARIIFISITLLAAIVIFSSTVGKDWYEGQEQTIQSFAIIHFSGYLFFLLMPVELAFANCVSVQQHFMLIISIALGTAVIAQTIDYYIGYFIKADFLFKYMGKKQSVRAERIIRKYGNLTIFTFNLFPLSSPIISLTAGMIKYPFKKVLFYSISGLMLKYIAIAAIIYYWW